MPKQIEMVVTNVNLDASGIAICTRATEYKPELEKHGWTRSKIPLSFDPNEPCIKSLDKNKDDYTFRVIKTRSDVVYPTIRGETNPATTVMGEMRCKFRNHNIVGQSLGNKYIDVWCGDHL